MTILFSSASARVPVYTPLSVLLPQAAIMTESASRRTALTTNLTFLFIYSPPYTKGYAVICYYSDFCIIIIPRLYYVTSALHIYLNRYL